MTGDASLPAMLLRRAAEMPARVALRQKQFGVWEETTWREYARRVASVAMGLRSLGVEPGNRVAVHSDNRLEWVLTDLAVQGLGAISVGVYPTCPPAEVQYLLSHAGAKVLIAEDEEQLDKVLEVREELPDLGHVVVIDTRGVAKLDDRTISFEELEARGGPGDATDAYRASVEGLRPDDVAIIVYTSGTTGPPKGAMLTHANLIAAGRVGREMFDVGPRDEVLSYLPLCHVAERLVSVIDAVSAGYLVNFGESAEAFLSDLREVQPTFFVGVPRVWEKMYAGVEIRMEDTGRLQRATYRFWTRRGLAIGANRRRAGRLGAWSALLNALGSFLLYRSLRDKLGLRRVRLAISGAAPIAPQVLEWFWSIGVPIREIYGQTENTAICTFMPGKDVRIGTVGTAVDGVELRIADDGEILVRSPGVFAGYYRDEEATKEAIGPDGLLRTGDVGSLDADGYLTITDRKKDIIITSGGKNIAPQYIENLIKVSPYVCEAIVIGDGRPYVTALIGVEPDTVGDWCTRHDIPFTTFEDLSCRAEVLELVGGVIEQVNGQLAQAEQLKRFRLLPVELDEQDGQLTATQKVKRAAIAEQFSELIEGMYA